MPLGTASLPLDFGLRVPWVLRGHLAPLRAQTGLQRCSAHRTKPRPEGGKHHARRYHRSHARDPRYRSHLEAQLAQADEGIRTRDATIGRYIAEISPLRAENARLKPLAEAAIEHRQKAEAAAKAQNVLGKKLAAAENRILGLEELVAAAEEKIARLESELAGYDELNARVANAKALRDLFTN